jgi:hypothetical protein
MRKRVVYVALECGLWLVVLLAAYGQRDAWRAGDWWQFVFASALGGIVASLLRKHIAVSAKEAPADGA